MRNLFFVLLIGISPMLLNAKPSTTDNVPAELNNVKNQLMLVGKAKFSVLFWDIYDSALFSASGDYQAQNAYLFEITYLREISKADLIERTVEQWQHIGVPENAYAPYLEQLEQLWPNINKGDQLAMWFNGTSTAFYFNQKLQGQIDSPEFSEMFVNIWLSPQTSQPKLRKKLLGKR
ncbi:chalcone isomerase family protein [Thalassotalea euphylliae]|nr:chalcone isomerase family protein [Thalassotalea euphylliae]